MKSSDLYHGIQSFNIPNPTPLPKTGDPCWDEDEYPDIPYMIVGDEAFQLANYMMKPYSTSRQTNKWCLTIVCLAFAVSENAFVIFVSRFRTFLSRINLKNLSSINNVILAGVVLHNMLCEKSHASYMPTEYMDREDQNTGEVICGQWRESVPNSFLEQGPTVLGCRGTRRAGEIRNTLNDFFNGPGALSWQENILK